MANTFELINSVTVPSGGSSAITFSSIPNTFTDLCVKLSIRTNRGSDNDALFMSINGNTASLSNIIIESTGSGNAASYPTSGSTLKSAAVDGDSATSSTFGNAEFYFPNYAGSTYKTVLWEESSDKNGSGAVSRNVGLWRSTSAITNIQLSDSSGRNFGVGTTATLYGIKAA